MRMRLNRKWKTARNLLAAALCILLAWALMDFPPLTYQMLLRQTARENLVPCFDVLYDEPFHTSRGHADGRVSYLRCGNDFWVLCYARDGLRFWTREAELFKPEGAILVMPSREDGQMLALGDMGDAVSAELTWTIQDYYGETQVCTLTGTAEQASGELLRFPIPETATDAERTAQKGLQMDAWPEERFAYTLRLYDADGCLLREVSGAPLLPAGPKEEE